MLLPLERQERILSLLEIHDKLLTQQIADEVGASLATVRRDLTELSERGLVARTHGGIMRARLSLTQEPAFAAKAARMRREKAAIALRASQEIPNGATVILDAGTTMQEVARCLAGRPITAITLDLPAAQTLAVGETEVLLLGGRVRSNSFSITGPWTEAYLRDLHADVYLMGAHAVDERGVSNAGLEEAVVKRLAIAASARTVLLADHTKFGARAMAQVCPLDQVQQIITDAGAADLPWLRTAGPELVLAAP